MGMVPRSGGPETTQYAVGMLVKLIMDSHDAKSQSHYGPPLCGSVPSKWIHTMQIFAWQFTD